jgi:phosphoribosylformimino-5-aminoimidazole carboxamide ribotide isomerase
MILLPAIDILDGKAVRLAKGNFDAKTEYDADPLEAARRWVSNGARALHVVDLDGARSGSPQNLDHVTRIAQTVDVPVQVGGGLRTVDDVRRAVDAGASRVVLGTAAYTDVDFIDTVLTDHGERVIVSVDVREGKLAASGWTQQTEIPAESVIQQLGGRGVKRFVYSNIDRDGMLEGPDLSEVQRIAGTVRGSFIYSGGVSTLDDLHALVALRQVNLSGVIVGKALYERRFDVSEAQRILDGDRQDGKRH